MSVRAKVVRAPSEAVLSEITRERFARLRREKRAAKRAETQQHKTAPFNPIRGLKDRES